jgi:pimeloyl-ACP methyl ester carboxylesterase
MNQDIRVFEKRIIVQGLRTTYKIVGQGQPVLILHGWGGSSDTWNHFLKQHTQRDAYAFISVDLPGFGKTDDPPVPWSVSDYVQFVRDFISALMLENVVVIGHSFGGRITIKLTSQYPEKVDAAILVAAAGIKHPKNVKQRVSTFVAKQGKRLVNASFLERFEPFLRKVLYKVIRENDYVQTKGVMRETFVKVISEDLSPFLEKIQMPTLIIWGTKDTYVPVSDAYTMHESINGSLLEVIHGARHGIHKEMPGRLYKLITHFIAK